MEQSGFEINRFLYQEQNNMKVKIGHMIIILVVLIITAINIYSQTVLSTYGYFGQTPPGNHAIVFAPDFISKSDIYAQSGVFSPNGKEFYFTVANNKWDYFEIRHSSLVNGKWTTPVKDDFFGVKSNMEPFFSSDGKRVYFNYGDLSGTDIWYCEKENEKWGKPVKLPEPVNTSSFEWYPTLSKNNTLFLTRNGDIFYFTSNNGQFNKEVNLGTPVNSSKYEEADPYISSNEDFLIFHSYGRPDGYGQGDLYISFKKENDKWTNPKNLGPQINTNEFEFGPSLTPDGKYFLFSRRKQWQTDIPSKIFWIKSDFIDSLKHTNYIPYPYTLIPKQSIKVGKLFKFTLPENTFIDDDGNKTLNYSAVLNNNTPLPSWLKFDSATLTFSGTPTTAGLFIIKIKVIDNANADAFCLFDLEVN